MTVPRARTPSGPDRRSAWSSLVSGVSRLGKVPPLHVVLAVTGMLLLVGVVMVLSASAGGRTVADGMVLTVFVRHLIFLLTGVAAFAAGMTLRPSVLRAWTPLLLLACVVALVLVLVPGIGEVRGGARRWISVGGFTVQPGEAVKVVLLLWGAHVLALRGRAVRHARYAVLPLVPVVMIVAALLMLQPALSTTVALGVVLVALLFFAGAPLGLIAALSGGAVLGATVLGLTAGYRRERLTTFLGSGDELGAGYQSRQALLSLADGGLFGTGLGQGRAKWDYLPNAANDFVFAVIGEELGLLGGIAVLGLYAVLAWVGLRVAARTRDPFLRLVTAATATWVVVQAVMNVGYVVGLLPVTGQQLPLVSAGGTALVSTLFLLGLVANAARRIR
ncbi:Cell division protein FtsW [Pseudonocardia sp. Ae168_Ps1]|uniref:FtsW/RodA/SpoVE family cell cycle protein n=1 Tax=unclassified Pseudonocardia TaxID=2619320 RepID=UPI00094B2314|nr:MULTISPECIES: putative peptidoglycan glycosyltransferase FtsW [unclassified Pseudonocardia]OLL73517.1 Cell division protein FtsW [Pseudonocardia sp. Ae150A_Ps1]OLL79488.1 Cell division protein FtsW [Pseudonocardia sp. Ae168_Ps1]OLL86372.1 Cell division protein FtsW [Pseudonocardia sp. Ae263_Ps1]OLL93584.1 Cell division protein FtsW [Pseudonocardia sp. Ae356_Ps1]